MYNYNKNDKYSHKRQLKGSNSFHGSTEAFSQLQEDSGLHKSKLSHINS